MTEDEHIPDAKISPDQQRTVDQFLLQAVSEYKYDRINLVLQKGANIDAQGENGYTALMRAVNMGSAYMVKFIVSKNPDMFVKDNWNRTAFDMLQYVKNQSERDEMTDAMLGALPDHIRQAAPSNDDAIKMAAAEAALKKPAENIAPERAQFKAKTPKGFNP